MEHLGISPFKQTRFKKKQHNQVTSDALFQPALKDPFSATWGFSSWMGTEVQAGRPDTHLAHPMRLLVLEILYKSIDYIVIHASCVIITVYIYMIYDESIVYPTHWLCWGVKKIQQNEPISTFKIIEFRYPSPLRPKGLVHHQFQPNIPRRCVPGSRFISVTTCHTVGQNPANQLSLVVYPIIYRVSYIPGGAGFPPQYGYCLF